MNHGQQVDAGMKAALPSGDSPPSDGAVRDGVAAVPARPVAGPPPDEATATSAPQPEGASAPTDETSAPPATADGTGADGNAASDAPGDAPSDALIEKYKTGILAVVAMKKGSQNRAGTGSQQTIRKYLQPDFEVQGIEWNEDLFKGILKQMLQSGELVTNMTKALYMLPSVEMALEAHRFAWTNGSQAETAPPPNDISVVATQTEISIALPTGSLGAGIRKDEATGMCVVSESIPGSLLHAKDTILSLNGIRLAEVDDAGVDTWVKIFSIFASGPRRVVVRRDRPGPIAAMQHPNVGGSFAAENPGKSWVNTSEGKRCKTGTESTVTGLQASKPNVPDGKMPKAEDFMPFVTASIAKEGPLSQPTIKKRIQPQMQAKGFKWDDSMFSAVLKQMLREKNLVKKKASYKLPRITTNGCLSWSRGDPFGFD